MSLFYLHTMAMKLTRFFFFFFFPNSLFYGQAKSYILSKEGARSKEERWCDIKIDVATGSRDIYAAIDGAFDIQKVNVGDSVAEQFSAISRLPPVLQIQVQRVQFDPVKKRSFKSTHHLELMDTIYLDRYMDTQQPEIMDRRRQCWEWKDNLRKLEARRDELLRTEVRTRPGLDAEDRCFLTLNIGNGFFRDALFVQQR